MVCRKLLRMEERGAMYRCGSCVHQKSRRMGNKRKWRARMRQENKIPPPPRCFPIQWIYACAHLRGNELSQGWDDFSGVLTLCGIHQHLMIFTEEACLRPHSLNKRSLLKGKHDLEGLSSLPQTTGTGLICGCSVAICFTFTFSN